MSTLTRLEAVSRRRYETQRGWERLIRQAHKDGHSLRQIAAVAGVSHTAIAKILAR